MAERTGRESRGPTVASVGGDAAQVAPGKRTLVQAKSRGQKKPPWPAGQEGEAEPKKEEAEAGEGEAEEGDKPEAAMGGGGGGESEAAETESAEPEPVQAKAAAGGVVQRLKYKGAVVDIATLTDAGKIREHIQRFHRRKHSKEQGDDKDYEYDAGDLDLLQKQEKKVKADEQKRKHDALVIELQGQLASLATEANFVTPPPWTGRNPPEPDDTEVFKNGTMKAEAATVVAAWKAFLGAGPYSNKHPRTGVATVGKLVSGDGKRSIRYGKHEAAAGNPTAHHYHEESWSYDAGSNKLTLTNHVQRVPVN